MVVQVYLGNYTLGKVLNLCGTAQRPCGAYRLIEKAKNDMSTFPGGSGVFLYTAEMVADRMLTNNEIAQL